MTNPDKDNQDLIKKLRQMRRVAERNPEQEKKGRESFLAAVEALGDPPQTSQKDSAVQQPGPSSLIGRLAKAAASLALAGLAAFSVGLLAQEALPGEALHPIKLRMEEIEVGWQADGAQRARLLLRNSSRRLDEIRNLITLGREGAIDPAINLYVDEINQLNEELAGLQGAGRDEFVTLLGEVSQTLSEHEAATLNLLDSEAALDLSALERVLVLSGGSAEDEEEIEETQELVSRIVSVSPDRGEAGRQMSLYVRAQGASFSSDSQAVFGPSGAIELLEVILLGPDELILRIHIQAGSEAEEISLHIIDGETRWEGGEFTIFVSNGNESLESEDQHEVEDIEGEEADGEAGDSADDESGDDDESSDQDEQAEENEDAEEEDEGGEEDDEEDQEEND